MARIALATLVSAGLLAAVTSGGCESSGRARTDQTRPAAEPHQPDSPLHELMYAKLGHARAALAGLVTGDYDQIEISALAMRRLSENTAWMVTDSVTYVVMSDEFRAIADDLADHARTEDLIGASADFSRLTESCVRCHEYLRRELFERALPGKVSQGNPRGGVRESLDRAGS